MASTCHAEINSNKGDSMKELMYTYKVLVLLIILLNGQLVGQEMPTEGILLMQNNTKHGLIGIHDAKRAQSALTSIRAQYSNLSSIKIRPKYVINSLLVMVDKDLELERIQVGDQQVYIIKGQRTVGMHDVDLHSEQGSSSDNQESHKYKATTLAGLNDVYSAYIEEVQEEENHKVLVLKFNQYVDVERVKEKYQELTINSKNGVLNVMYNSPTAEMTGSYPDGITLVKDRKKWKFIFYNASGRTTINYYPANERLEQEETRPLLKKKKFQEEPGDCFCC